MYMEMHHLWIWNSRVMGRVEQANGREIGSGVASTLGDGLVPRNVVEGELGNRSRGRDIWSHACIHQLTVGPFDAGGVYMNTELAKVAGCGPGKRPGRTAEGGSTSREFTLLLKPRLRSDVPKSPENVPR